MEPISGLNRGRRQLIMGGAALGSSLAALGSRPAGAAAPGDRSHQAFNVRDFGAIGDGNADDTKALQSAIDHAFATGTNCYLPGGTYRITETIVIGSTFGGGNNRAGWRLFGDGGKSDAGSGIGGTLIRLHGAGLEAVLKIGSAAWRACVFEDFGLECVTLGGAAYGLLLNSTEFSGHAISRVHVARAGTAFAILVGTGRNGENTLFSDCYAGSVDRFFYSNAGQAYVQTFFHCGGILNANGSWFHLDTSSGGGGINVIDFNGTGTTIPGSRVSNTTLFQDGGNNSCCNFFGGRIENVTQLINCPGGSVNLRPAVSFFGMQIATDSFATDLQLSKPAFVNLGPSAHILTIQSCQFDGSQGGETVLISMAQSHCHVVFRECSFQALGAPPWITNNMADIFAQISFENCKCGSLTGLDESNDRPFGLNRYYGGAQLGAVGMRRPYSTNAFIHSGRPQNYLVRPEFSLKGGTNVTLDDPWVHYGSSLTLTVTDWNDRENPPNTPSALARNIAIPARSGIYQDVTAIDLSSVAGTVSNLNINYHLVNYQMMLTSSASSGPNTDFRIAIEDSVTGVIYDQIVFSGTADGGGNVAAKTIILNAAVRQRSAAAYPRIKIENNSASGTIQLRIAWHMVGRDDRASYAPSSLSPIVFGEEWSANAESIRAWSRLAIPYKSDRYGRSAGRPLNDLQSDRYQSSDTEREVAWQNGRWWDRPMVTRAAAPPTSGQWACGAQIYNSSPTAGGVLGWIQVVAGDLAATTQWVGSTAFTAGTRAYNATNVYECIVDGRSSKAAGPTGTEVVIIDGTCKWRFLGTLAPIACSDVWAVRTTYSEGTQVCNNNRVYQCVATGTSDAAGGPAGTDAAIVDGTAKWKYAGPLAVFKTFGIISE